MQAVWVNGKPKQHYWPKPVTQLELIKLQLLHSLLYKIIPHSLTVRSN